MLYLHLLWSMSVAPCPYISASSVKILVFQTLYISSSIHYLGFKNSKINNYRDRNTNITKRGIMIQNISTIAHKLPPSLQYSSLEDCVYCIYDFWVLFDLRLFKRPQPKVRTLCLVFVSSLYLSHYSCSVRVLLLWDAVLFQKWRAEPRVRGSSGLITLTNVHLCGRQRRVPEDLTDYGVEQRPRTQLGSENQSDFLSEMKFTPSEWRERSGGTNRCTAATLRISSFVSAWLLECLSSWKLCHTNPSCRVFLVPERGHQGPGRKWKHTGLIVYFLPSDPAVCKPRLAFVSVGWFSGLWFFSTEKKGVKANNSLTALPKQIFPVFTHGDYVHYDHRSPVWPFSQDLLQGYWIFWKWIFWIWWVFGLHLVKRKSAIGGSVSPWSRFAAPSWKWAEESCVLGTQAPFVLVMLSIFSPLIIIGNYRLSWKITQPITLFFHMNYSMGN